MDKSTQITLRIFQVIAGFLLSGTGIMGLFKSQGQPVGLKAIFAFMAVIGFLILYNGVMHIPAPEPKF